VEAAETAFEFWVDTPPNQKCNIFLKIVDILEHHIQEFGKWEEEAGTTNFYASGFNAPTTVNGVRDVTGKISSQYLHCQIRRESAIVMKEPYGVILGIAIWYYF
jgi:phenylacetaldehyde dehydrogenase